MDALMTVADEAEGLHAFGQAKRRNLGVAILLEAIQDYRGADQDLHASAARFLFPQGAVWQNHYDWVVGMAVSVNAQWLRNRLDQSRGKWDAQRHARKLLRTAMPGRW